MCQISFFFFGEICGCVDFNLVEARENLFHDTGTARGDPNNDTATVARMRHFGRKTQALKGLHHTRNVLLAIPDSAASE